MQNQFRPSSLTLAAATRTAPASAVLLAAALGFAVAAAQADVMPWTGDTDNDWNTDTNWGGGVVPDELDIAEFYAVGAANLSVTLSSESTIDGLAFGSNATDPVTINVTGAALLRLDGGAATDIEVLAGSHTIEGEGNESGDPPEMIASGGQQIWHVAENATLAINARLNTAPWPSNGTTYRKQGPGTLVLGGDNGGNGGWNFTGGGFFFVDEGTLSMTHRSAGGNSHNAFVVNTGATLELTADAHRYICTNGTLNINGHGVDGVGALYIDRPGEVTNLQSGSGSLFMNSDATIGVSAGSTFAIAQNITGTGSGASLTKVGEGTLILTSPDNSYGGSGSNERTTISEGTLTLAPEGELRIRILNNGVSHRIDGSGTANLEGVLRLRTNQVTDTKGTWKIVDVSTLTVNWGETFNLAFLDEEDTFTNEGGGMFTSDDWTFNQATGNLTLGPLPKTCQADLTDSGSVGVSDLLELLGCWGDVAPGGGCENADLTGSGSVGVPDLLDLLGQWGPCPE